MNILLKPSKEDLLNAKFNLYKILESFEKDELNDIESNLLFELSFDENVEAKILEEKYGE